MEPPFNQQYFRVPYAHFRSNFTLRCDRPVPCLTVLWLLSLPRSEQGWWVESVRTWFCRAVMVDIRLVTCSVVARLDWARFSMCVLLVRVTLWNSSIYWACLAKWAWKPVDSEVDSCCKSRWEALKFLTKFVHVWLLAGRLRQSLHASFILPDWNARLYSMRTICASTYGLLPLVAYAWPSSIWEYIILIVVVASHLHFMCSSLLMSLSSVIWPYVWSRCSMSVLVVTHAYPMLRFLWTLTYLSSMEVRSWCLSTASTVW